MKNLLIPVSLFLVLSSAMAATKSDAELNQKLREKLMTDESLSPDARSITIVTKGHTMTLQGQVKKEEEIRKVSILANEVAAGKDVVNELTVKQ